MRVLVEVGTPLDVGAQLVVDLVGDGAREEERHGLEERERLDGGAAQGAGRAPGERRAVAVGAGLLVGVALCELVEAVALAGGELALVRERLGEDEGEAGDEGAVGAEGDVEGGEDPAARERDEGAAEQGPAGEPAHEAAAEEREDARARAGRRAVADVGRHGGLCGTAGVREHRQQV